MSGSSGWNCCTADVGWTACYGTAVNNHLWNNGAKYWCDYACDESCCRINMYNDWKKELEAQWRDYNNRYGFSDGNIDNLHYPT